MTIADIAQACYEGVRAEINSLEFWDDISKEHQQCAIKGVKYYLKYPDIDPKMNCDAWLAVCPEDWWTYKKEKTPIIKIKPLNHCVSEEQNIKCSLFKSIVEQLKGHLENQG